MKITLTYFDVSTSRGEECRLALHLAGLPFTDERLNQDQWKARKASTPFGALPVLTVEGFPTIAQSNAILRLIGGLGGLHPADPWEAARHEAVMGAIEDMRVRLGPTGRIKDADEKKRAREEFAAGHLTEWAGNVEKQLGEPFVGGAKPNVVDLKLFVTMSTLLKGSIDHISPHVFKPFPKLLRLFEAVKTHPKVAAWYAPKARPAYCPSPATQKPQRARREAEGAASPRGSRNRQRARPGNAVTVAVRRPSARSTNTEAAARPTWKHGDGAEGEPRHGLPRRARPATREAAANSNAPTRNC